MLVKNVKSVEPPATPSLGKVPCVHTSISEAPSEDFLAVLRRVPLVY